MQEDSNACVIEKYAVLFAFSSRTCLVLQLVFYLFTLVSQRKKILTSRWNSVQLFAFLYRRVKVWRNNRWAKINYNFYLICTKSIPLITLSISSTLPIEGGWICMGGKVTPLFPVQISFIFFCRTTAWWVKWRKHSDDSFVFSCSSPSCKINKIVMIYFKK